MNACDVGVIVHMSDLCPENVSGNLPAIHRFVGALESRIDFCFNMNMRDLHLLCPVDRAALDTACFFLGCYMILVQNDNVKRIYNFFHEFLGLNLTSRVIGRFDHESTIVDSWRTLKRAKDSGLVPLPRSSEPSIDGPFQAVGPKLILLRNTDVLSDVVDLVIRDRSITAIVRLLADHTRPTPPHLCPGVRQVHLSFDDGANPPPSAVSFLFRKVVDCADGAVALVCGEDGPPGGAETLAALHLMRRHGFLAAEAAAWVEMAGLGSGLGAAQRRYLAAVEELMKERAAQYGVGWPGSGSGSEWCAAAAAPSLAKCKSMLLGDGREGRSRADGGMGASTVSGPGGGGAGEPRAANGAGAPCHGSSSSQCKGGAVVDMQHSRPHPAGGSPAANSARLGQGPAVQTLPPVAVLDGPAISSESGTLLPAPEPYRYRPDSDVCVAGHLGRVRPGRSRRSASPRRLGHRRSPDVAPQAT